MTFKATHGESRTRLYRIWRNIKSRCYNPKFPRYVDYGARGIAMCAEWETSYERFRDWAIENGYRSDLFIDRKDNDGNYGPDNCRWVDVTTSNLNQRSNHRLIVDGLELSISEWAKHPLCLVKEGTLRNRISLGWPHKEAVTTPNQPPAFRKRRAGAS